MWAPIVLWMAQKAGDRMEVSIYSREAVTKLLKDGTFPKNAAVVSFYDPPDGKWRSPGKVDYSSVDAEVIYVPARDIDPPVLEREGLSFDDYFREVDEVASFILSAVRDGKSLICQCEYGQSRSAACAAAIKQFFSGDGIEVFADYRYYPNQMIYHKVFDALSKACDRNARAL